MTIISMKDGHKVWDTEVIRKNDWKIDELIGTRDMKEGHEYQVRVSNNWNFSPMGAAKFKIIKDATIPVILFPLVIPIFRQREFLQKEIDKFKDKRPLTGPPQDEHIKRQLEEKLRQLDDEERIREENKFRVDDPRQPDDDITKKKVRLYIYRTELDKRVCPICKKFESKIYLPTEELPDIPQHENCRCHMEVVYHDSFEASFTDVLQVIRIANTAKKGFKAIRAVRAL